MAFSPDGTRMAFVSKAPKAPFKIYLRSLDQWEAVPLPIDGDVGNPFFSPDGKWLGFYSFSEQKLMKVAVDGGTPTTILDVREASLSSSVTQGGGRVLPLGVSWGSDDSVVFAPEPESGLWRVSAAGGQPEQITVPDKKLGEVSHRLPHLLPGGEAVIYTVFLQSAFAKGTEQIVVQHLVSGERRVLVENGTDGRYISSGHLVFAREGTLMAAPFDLGSLTLNGSPVRVLEGVGHCIFTVGDTSDSGAAQFSFSASGSLAYIPGSFAPENKRQVVWLDRSGRVKATGIPPANYYHVRLSADNSEVLLGEAYRGPNIWRYDFVRGTRTIQTAEVGGAWPEWTPDEAGFVFSSPGLDFNPSRGGFRSLFRKPIDSAEAPDRLTAGESHVFGSWHPDGNRFVFLQRDPGNDWGIWMLSGQGFGSIEELVRTEHLEANPAFSPDGNWLAYYSFRDGRAQVYVQPYPGPSRERTISPSGGYAPAWAPNGKELFYCSSGKMMAVEISANKEPWRNKRKQSRKR